MRSERGLVFKMWLKNPRGIGAIAGSSPDLARAMARQIPKDDIQKDDGWVVELGGGTGAVTKAILESGVARDRLLVVERDPTLHDFLTNRYPDIRILLGDAQELPSLLRLHKIGKVDAIVSSLPLLAMKKSQRCEIALAAFSSLAPGRPFIQFTYGWLSPLPRRRLGIEGKVQERVMQNLPPASVWVYKSLAHRQNQAA